MINVGEGQIGHRRQRLSAQPEQAVGLRTEPQGSVFRLIHAIDGDTQAGVALMQLSITVHIAQQLVVALVEYAHRLVAFRSHPIASVLVGKEAFHLSLRFYVQALCVVVVRTYFIDALIVQGPEVASGICHSEGERVERDGQGLLHLVPCGIVEPRQPPVATQRPACLVTVCPRVGFALQ